MLDSTQLRALQELNDAQQKIRGLAWDWNVEADYIDWVEANLETLSSAIIANNRSRYCRACEERLPAAEALLNHDTNRHGCSRCRRD